MKKTKTSKVKTATKAKTKTGTKPRRVADKHQPPHVEQVERPADGADSRSIVGQKFRDRYRDSGGNCGDEIAQQIAAHVSVRLEGSSKTRIDPAKLKKLAERNGVWKDRYGKLNLGLQRMTISNCLRKIERAGQTIDWR